MLSVVRVTTRSVHAIGRMEPTATARNTEIKVSTNRSSATRLLRVTEKATNGMGTTTIDGRTMVDGEAEAGDATSFFCLAK